MNRYFENPAHEEVLPAQHAEIFRQEIPAQSEVCIVLILLPAGPWIRRKGGEMDESLMLFATTRARPWGLKQVGCRLRPSSPKPVHSITNMAPS
jgi:hypothetical protein